MRSSNPADPLLQALASLPAVEPDPARANALRERCRAALESSPNNDPLAILEPTAVSVVCATYAWQMIKLANLLGR